MGKEKKTNKTNQWKREIKSYGQGSEERSRERKKGTWREGKYEKKSEKECDSGVIKVKTIIFRHSLSSFLSLSHTLSLPLSLSLF